MRSELHQRATAYVWKHCGRGLSTAVGIHTRELIRDAFKAGVISAERVAKKKAKARA